MAVTPILSIPLVAPTQTDKTTTLNDAIAAIEDATQDQLAVDMSAGNVTLTATQFTRHAVFMCSGLTADRDLVVPLTKRVFVVRNASAHNLTVKGASGATVVIAAGDGSIIHDDGTNCVELAAGGAGVAGPTGLAGGAITIPYTFSTTTTNADPGGGTLRLNNATQNLTTAIYVDLLASDTTDWTTVLDSLDDSTSAVKGHIRLFDRADDSKWILFTTSAVVSHTGYRELTVAVVSASAASPFSNSDTVSIAFSRTGNVGSTGSTGSSGAPGSVWYTGTGAPSGGLGINGDYYLDTASGNVYHKDTGNSPAWGVVATLIGAASTVVIDATAPSSPIEGELWWSLTDGKLYIWTSTAWAEAVGTGATGPAGPAGSNAFGDLTGTADFSQLPASVQQLPLGFVMAGKPTTGQVFNFPMAMAVTIPASLTGTKVYDTTLATSSAIFTVNKIVSGNTITSIGTVTITTTNHFSCTLAGAGGSLAAGDVLQIVCPTQDATLSDIGITILAART